MTSASFRHSLSIDAVCNVVTWSSSSTFTKHSSMDTDTVKKLKVKEWCCSLYLLRTHTHLSVVSHLAVLPCGSAQAPWWWKHGCTYLLQLFIKWTPVQSCIPPSGPTVLCFLAFLAPFPVSSSRNWGIRAHPFSLHATKYQEIGVWKKNTLWASRF